MNELLSSYLKTHLRIIPLSLRVSPHVSWIPFPKKLSQGNDGILVALHEGHQYSLECSWAELIHTCPSTISAWLWLVLSCLWESCWWLWTLALVPLSATSLCLLVMNPKFFNSIGPVRISASCLGSLINSQLYILLYAGVFKTLKIPQPTCQGSSIATMSYHCKHYLEKDCVELKMLLRSLPPPQTMPVYSLNSTNLLVFLLPLPRLN